MKILGLHIDFNFLKQILISIFLGWLIGLGISYVNISGSSQHAPLICAFAAGIAAVARLRKQNIISDKS